MPVLAVAAALAVVVVAVVSLQPPDLQYVQICSGAADDQKSPTIAYQAALGVVDHLATWMVASVAALQ